MSIMNVFRRDGEAIRHFWGSELLYVPPEAGQEYRHNDLLDPLWNTLDLTPEGRGDFHPQLRYAGRSSGHLRQGETGNVSRRHGDAPGAYRRYRAGRN